MIQLSSLMQMHFIPSFLMELSIAEEILDHLEKTFYIYSTVNSFYLADVIVCDIVPTPTIQFMVEKN